MCKSINFIERNKTCQINDAEPGGCNDELLESVGNSFVAASTFPEELAGPCTGHDCKLNEVCMPKGTAYSCSPWFSQMSKRNFKQIFVACSGNNLSVLETWRNPSLGEDIENHSNNLCTNRHLRSSMIDNWDTSSIDRV
ncbi:Hypothetical predicted protein [Mytilus galloprovincialis]|uniref:Uncharacterized protein n=1 Tax=Mytilus galloprovincialis TaxID=29158 RepID=A0A8B6FBI0_MYTGA|nr:Hypothetical predicted protein [Mytilus galloprovincialis]